nr:hypothetical protein [Tanacetum cinerariifolium]
GKNTEAGGSASRQAQQTKHTVGQDGSGGSGVGVVISLFDVDGAGGVGGPDVYDSGKFLMVDEEDLIFKKISPMVEEIMVMLHEGLEKKVSDIVWYTDEIRDQVEKITDGDGGYLKDYVRVVVGTDDEGKQSGDLVEMSSEAVEQGMGDHVPDEIDGAKNEQLPNHVVKKCNLGFLVCKPWW